MEDDFDFVPLASEGLRFNRKVFRLLTLLRKARKELRDLEDYPVQPALAGWDDRDYAWFSNAIIPGAYNITTLINTIDGSFPAGLKEQLER